MSSVSLQYKHNYLQALCCKILLCISLDIEWLRRRWNITPPQPETCSSATAVRSEISYYGKKTERLGQEN